MSFNLLARDLPTLRFPTCVFLFYYRSTNERNKPIDCRKEVLKKKRSTAYLDVEVTASASDDAAIHRSIAVNTWVRAAI